MQAIEQTIAQDFNFEVLKQPLYSPDMAKTPVYGLFRSDNRQFIGKQSWTDKYQPHRVEDVAALVQAAGSLFDDQFNLKCLWKDGHVVFIQPTKEQRKEICRNDGVFPRLIIKAQYNGRAFSATAGVYRDACLNLMMLRTVKSTSILIRHTNSLQSKMDELIADFQQLAGAYDNVYDACIAMEQRKVDAKDFFHAILGDVPAPESETKDGSKLTRYKNTLEAMTNRIIRERYVTGRATGEPVTAWECYNAVQGYVQHEKTRKGKVTEWDRVLLASEDAIVKHAETLALSM